MAEQKGEKKEPLKKSCARKWLWRAAIFLTIVLIVLGFLWISGLRGSQSAEERLAAIEAERAIPDEENAAIIYNQLWEAYDDDTFLHSFLTGKTDTLTTGGPWLSKDHPEVAEWIKEQQGTISQLLKASSMEKCRFPIIIDPQEMAGRMEQLRTMSQWAFLLRRAANNDLGEGRIDDAAAKYACLARMANHLHQQPVLVDYLVGIAVEALALQAIGCLIVEGDATEAHLESLEAALPGTKDNWSNDSSAILEVEQLLAGKHYGPLRRLILFWHDRYKKTRDRMRELYLRTLTNRRGIRILIALRHRKNETGQWPQGLDEIRSSLAKETLTDPYNNGSFVYRLTEDGFSLYSKGKNNIDEDAKYRGGADNWPIWPPIGRKTGQKGGNAK